MATINFKNAVGRIHFDGGMTDDGKLIRKSKSYRNIGAETSATSLYKGLEELAALSSLPLIEVEKIETSGIIN
ncbi:DUF1659 domain-containing protein [Sporosarcina sp. FA9]|uniref:DUF1659 domain-containing protein n=1 Tax=Sporosarcina sp. FA9 TaxID=3413030 RepID=UPI003F655DD3